MAGENYHHGPELIESSGAGYTVSDVKAAVLYLQGTAPIHLVHTTAPARAPYINQPIVIRTPEQAVAAFGPDNLAAAGYSIPQALSAIFAKDRDRKGVGTIVVNNVFDPDVHKTGATPDVTLVSATDMVGGLDAGGRPLGFNVAYACYNRFGFFPRRMIAPRFCGLAGVRAKMEVVANNVRGHAIIDLPVGITVQQAIETRGPTGGYNTASNRVALCYPQVKALDAATGDLSLQPFSQHFAGVWNRSVSQLGPHESPSNVEMSDVKGTETDIMFMPGAYNTDTNLLNEAGIVTTMTYYGTGLHTWGASSAAWPTLKDEASWLHGRAVMDVVDDAVLFYMMPYIDRLATLKTFEPIEERVNAWLATKVRDSWLYGSSFAFDRQKTTSDEIVNQGRVHWKLVREPVGIMHRATVESYTDINFVKSALALAA